MTSTRHTRLSKESSDFIKKAIKIYFVNHENENLSLETIALIFLSNDVYVIAQDGDMAYWNADDVVRAKRSIKRLNTTCEIFDRRDYVIRHLDRTKSNHYKQIISDLILNNSEISAPEAILVVQRLDQEIKRLEDIAEKIFSYRKKSTFDHKLFSEYTNTVDLINLLRNIRYSNPNIQFKKYPIEDFLIDQDS